MSHSFQRLTRDTTLQIDLDVCVCVRESLCAFAYAYVSAYALIQNKKKNYS